MVDGRLVNSTFEVVPVYQSTNVLIYQSTVRWRPLMGQIFTPTA